MALLSAVCVGLTLPSQAPQQELAMVATPFLSLFRDSDYLDMECTVADLERFMSHENRNLVPLLDLDGRVFGVVSAGDVIAFHSAGGNPLAVRAWEICSHKLVKADIATPMEALVQLFVAHDVHHVLLTEQERIVGVASTKDVCRYVAKQSGTAVPDSVSMPT